MFGQHGDGRKNVRLVLLFTVEQKCHSVVSQANW